MTKRALNELKAQLPPGHFGMAAMPVHGKEETGAEKFRVGLSVFLPGGGAERSVDTVEKVYYVLEGEMTICDKNDNRYVIGKDESLSLLPGDERVLVNESNLPAKMLIIACYPDM